MPKKSKPKSPKQNPSKESSDFEQHLIEKIAKCQRVVNELTANPIWEEIRADFENTAKGLDLAWAYEDVHSPRFKQMQASKMAVQTFMSLLPTYQHDLEMAKKELAVQQNPKDTVKKDYDDEGTKGTQTISTTQGNAYHG